MSSDTRDHDDMNDDDATRPAEKATVPVGVPPLPLTVALNVTRLPATAGFAEELTTAVVGARLDCAVGGKNAAGGSSKKRA